MGVKVGDRVRVVRCSTDSHPSREGVVVRLAGRAHPATRVDLDGGGSCDAAVVSLLEPSEPYQPRSGDEITVSISGTVKEDGVHGWLIEARKLAMSLEDFDDYEVEVHKRGPEPRPKLPTTPGSVIQGVLGGRYALQEGGGWRSLSRQANYVADPFSGAFEILFDAGAS